MAQMEITAPVPATDELGQPQHFGWARSPCFTYDPSLIVSPRRYISESDRYVFLSSSHCIILEILDNGLLGCLNMSVISLTDKKRTSQTFSFPFALGLGLPPGSEKNSFSIDNKRFHLDFASMNDGIRIIRMDISRFGHHRSLRGEVVLSPPPRADSLVTHMPWRGEKNAFRCARRSPWYIVEGVIQFGASELVFSPGNGWGIYEWNRGVRSRRDVRFWAAGCGQSNGRLASFSIGYDSADQSLGTENGFFLDGRLHKLDQVTFHISPHNWLLPWRFTSNDNRLEMIFSPHQERAESHRFFIHSLKQRQVCGFFSGQAVLDSGEIFEFQHIMGFAERRKTRF